MFEANRARELYKVASTMPDYEMYHRQHEDEFEKLGERIKRESYLGKKCIRFFRTFYNRTFENESELYKKVLERYGYSVSFQLCDADKEVNEIPGRYVQYIVVVEW